MKKKISVAEKDFDTVKTFREIKEKISAEMIKMNFEEIKAYLKKGSQEFRQQQ